MPFAIRQLLRASPKPDEKKSVSGLSKSEAKHLLPDPWMAACAAMTFDLAIQGNALTLPAA